MKLQTEIRLQPEKQPMDYTSKVLLLGSCFAENIGSKLSYFKFQSVLNPFGILFHPEAIEGLVTRAINEDYFHEADLFEENDLWQCFEVHSSLSGLQKEEVLAQLNQNLDQLKLAITEASHISFTYGTAWTYRHIETDRIVANCHKVVQKKFLKELLTVEQIEATIDNTTTLIRLVNPAVSFIHTVSPVRHLKDGIVENMQSKAHLIAGLHKMIEPRKQMHYFPSYELFMDELRDYRFYGKDMIHPSELAIDIVWEKFKQVWVSSEITELQKEIDAIQKGLAHRSFQPDSSASKAFQASLQEKIQLLQQQIPHLTF